MATNNILLNVIATVSTTLSNGDPACNMIHRVFQFPLRPLLNKETALPWARNVSGEISIPLRPSVLEKIVESARHVWAGDRRFVTMSGLPFVTVFITVDHGVISAVGEFDRHNDDDDYGYDDDDDDDDDEDEYDDDDDMEEEYDGDEEEEEEEEEKEVVNGGDRGGGSLLELKNTVVEEQGKLCAICLEKLDVSCEAIRLRCSHLYHRDCIGTWLKKGKPQCPICRSQIP